MIKILTVVIPAYNVEKYIDKTINTLIIPDILDDIEILIINDGSFDTTKEKAMIYENLYPQSIRVISKSNGGHGSAINCGIENASGKYIKILDGDDWVEGIGMKKLVENLKRDSEYDLVLNPFETVDNRTGEKEKKEFPGIKYGYKYNFCELCLSNNVFGLPAITFRTSLLKENGICIDENKYYVDQEYILYPVPYIQSVILYEDCVYQYRIFNQAQSVSRDNFCKNRKMHQEIIYTLLEFLKQNERQMDWERTKYFLFAVSKMLSVQFDIYLLMCDGKEAKKEMIEFYKKASSLCPEVFSISKNRRIKLLIKSKFSLYSVIACITKYMKKGNK